MECAVTDKDVEETEREFEEREERVAGRNKKPQRLRGISSPSET